MRGVEDYLGQIKRLEEDGRRCTATLLSKTLGVSLPSASEMLKRLAEERYVQRDGDGTVTLTAEGRPLAFRVLLRHRLVERLLTEVMGMPWFEVHAEAHRIEHAVSARVEEALAQTLDFPDYCPHGLPMCPIDQRSLRRLDSIEASEEVGVAQISEIEESLLAYLDSLGVKPGLVIKVLEIAPSGGPFTLATDSGTVTLGKEVTGYVQVCPPDEVDWIERRAGVGRGRS